MFSRIGRKSSQILTIAWLVLFFWFASLQIHSDAIAVLRQHQEAPGILRYHSQHSLKDNRAMAWQVVLFPEPGKEHEFSLRLVGFPGLVEFEHPQPLELITSEGKLLLAKDAFDRFAPAPNVGQFDVTEVLPRLPQKGNLKLSVPLRGNKDLSLKIPQSILVEWQWLLKEI